MRSKFFTMVVIFLIGLNGQGTIVHGAFDQAKIKQAVEERLNEKIVQSGSFDMYDGEKDVVRNLRKTKELGDVIESDGSYFVEVEFRDINSGDIVDVEFKVSEENGEMTVDNIVIKNIREYKEDEALAEKEYSDQEIQNFMMEYLKKQGEFNEGRVMLFDEDANKMRNIELMELKPEVRRLGAYISSSSKFKDVDSGEILDVDISIENIKGKLNMAAMWIRNVRKGL